MDGTAGLTPAERLLVRQSPLFFALDAEDLASLIALGRPIDCAGPTLLFSQGDQADRFYVVLAGRVRLFIVTAQGRESVIEFVEPGLSFAEAAMFGTGRMPVNADVVAHTRLLQIPAAPMRARIAAEPRLARLMMDSLVRWQRRLIGRVAEFKVRSPSQRLAAALLALTVVSKGPASMHLPMSKTELAAHVGVTPESLSRAIARLRRVGVAVRGAEISIADVGALSRYCDGAAGTADPAGPPP